MEAAAKAGRAAVRVLGHRRSPVLIVAAAVVVMLPTLNSGWVMDDVSHRVQLLGAGGLSEGAGEAMALAEEGAGAGRAMQELYGFIRPENLEGYMEAGYVPWWTYEGLRAAFWRPVTGLTLWLDYQLCPNSAAAMHAHSILWFAAAVFALALTYRGLMRPAWVAGLAVLFYGLDDSFMMPVMMMANRNVLLAVFFGLVTFYMHRRWRREGHWAWGAAGALFFVLSLLSAEAGIAILVYLFSYALFLEEGGWRKGLAGLVPYVAVVVIWRVLYNAQGYGTYGCGFYSDPVREPVRYALDVLRRGPVLLVGQWFGIDAIAYSFMSAWAKVVYWGVCVLLVCFLGAMLWPLVRRKRAARFWLVGSLGAVLPICATSPMNRNLFFVGIGGMALAGQFVGGLFGREQWAAGRRRWRVAAWVLCVVLLAGNVGGGLGARAIIPRMVDLGTEHSERSADYGAITDIAEKDVVVVNMPNPLAVLWSPFLRVLGGDELPRSLRILSPGFVQMSARREDEHTLVLRAERGTFFGTEHVGAPVSMLYFVEHFYSLLRDSSHPLRLGEKVELPRFSAEVSDVDARGRAVEVRFRFATALEDASLVWLRYDPFAIRYYPFALPAVGESTYVYQKQTEGGAEN